MAEPDLAFIAEQLRRLLDEMAELRSDMAGQRDDMNVLTAMVIRLEGRVTRIDERLDRFVDRIVDRVRKLEETR